MQLAQPSSSSSLTHGRFRKLLLELEEEHERAIAIAGKAVQGAYEVGEQRTGADSSLEMCTAPRLASNLVTITNLTADDELPTVRITSTPWWKAAASVATEDVGAKKGTMDANVRALDLEGITAKTEFGPGLPAVTDNVRSFSHTSETAESTVAKVRRSSISSRSIKSPVHRNLNTAQQLLRMTFFLNGIGGEPNREDPLNSAPPHDLRYLVLLFLRWFYCALEVVRLAVLLVVSPPGLGEEGDALMAGILLAICASHDFLSIPFSMCRWKLFSRLRAFAAVLGSMLNEARAERLLSEMPNVIRGMHIRRFVFALSYACTEIFLLFGPGHEAYRTIALWPLPASTAVAALHVAVSVSNGFIMFFPDLDDFIRITTEHVSMQLEQRLEKGSAVEVSDEYETFCDYLDDVLAERSRHMTFPFLQNLALWLCMGSAIPCYPGSRYMPVFVVWVLLSSIFAVKLIQMAEENLRINKLAEAAAHRDSMRSELLPSVQDIHLKLRVSSRRPALVIMGFFEVTHANVFVVASFVLSLIFVIIFEIRTGV